MYLLNEIINYCAQPRMKMRMDPERQQSAQVELGCVVIERLIQIVGRSHCYFEARQPMLVVQVVLVQPG